MSMNLWKCSCIYWNIYGKPHHGGHDKHIYGGDYDRIKYEYGVEH